MKRHIKQWTIVALLLFSLSLVGCTEKFGRYNQSLYGATEDEMSRIPFGGSDLEALMIWVIPNQENGFQMSFSLLAGYISGYAGGIQHGADFSSYAPRSGWVTYPFRDTFTNHLYSFYRPLATKAEGDYSKPYFSLAQILRIAITHWVSDIYGPVPYSKISGESLSVAYDTQEELYTNMLADLKKAAEALDQLPIGYDAYASFDKVYGGDMHKWADYARSLMLRMAVRISAVAPAMAQEYAEWAVANGVITKNDNNATMPSNDNPLFKIESQWDNAVVGADIVEYLKSYNDPRLTAMVTQGSLGAYVGHRSNREDVTEESTISEYSKTNIGEDSSIYWLTASEVSFLKAEGTLLGWNMGGGDARSHYEEGIKLSFEQWGVSGVEAYLETLSTRKGYDNPVIPSQSVPSFKSEVTVNWDSAEGDVKKQKAMIATQKWIALFPYNTIEAWSEWRRTGYPNLLPALTNLSGGAVKDIYQDEEGRDRGGLRRVRFPQEEYEQNQEGVAVGVADLGGEDTLSTDLWWAKQ